MQSPSNSLRRTRPLLGTFVEVRVDSQTEKAAGAIEAAFIAMAQIHHLMSFHAIDSDVARINATAASVAVQVSHHTYRVLECARQIGDLSEGAFDIAIADILVKGGFLPPPPTGCIPSGRATYHDLELLPDHRVRWRQPGWIDLGGIAKGYAVDCAVETLRSQGICQGVVNAGGDLRCFGEPESIHVRHPEAPAALIHLGWLRDGAIATSGGYFSGNCVAGQRVDPLIDPRQHFATTWDKSISVIAPNCMIADALTKVVRLRPDVALPLLEHFNAQAVVIDHDGMRIGGTPWLKEAAPS